MINAYLVDDVTIIKYAGMDSWNEPLTPTEYDMKGKVEYKTRLVRNVRGEEVVSSAMVMLSDKKILNALGRDLDHEDRIRFGGVEHSIIMITRPKAFSGPHYEVFVA